MMKKAPFLSLCLLSALISLATLEASPGGGQTDAKIQWTYETASKEHDVKISGGDAILPDGTWALSLTSREDLDLLVLLIDVKNRKIGIPVTTRRTDSGWDIEVSFPKSGTYELQLSGKPRTDLGNTYFRLALASCKIKLAPSSPDARLASAVKAMDLVELKAALAGGANPDAPIDDSFQCMAHGQLVRVPAPAVFTVLTGSAPVDTKIAALKLLKARGANFAVTLDTDYSLLAAFLDASLSLSPEDRVKLLDTLLKCGADPRQETRYEYILDGKWIRTTVPLLIDLEKYGYGKAAEFAPLVPILIRAGADPHGRRPGGRTAMEDLFWRNEKGGKTLLRAYLDAGVKPDPDEVRAMVLSMETPSFDGDLTLAELALSNTSSLDTCGSSGRALLHVIAKAGKLPAPIRTRLLKRVAAKGADFNLSDKFGQTPLMAAVEESNRGAIDDLLCLGADPTRPGSSGRTVLHSIPKNLSPDEFATLVDRFLSAGVKLDARDDEGHTALYDTVACGGSLDLVKFLVDRGADPTLPDVDGYTALGCAKSNGYKETAAYLAALKVPVNSGGWPEGNAAPACKAVLGADVRAIAAMSGPDLAAKVARTSDGVPSTALHLAAEGGDAKVIAALAARKVDWNVRDRYGRTPLHLAVLRGKAEVVPALLAAGADLAAVDDWNETPLSRAIAARSPLLPVLLSGAKKNQWPYLAQAAAVSCTVAEAKLLSSGTWGEWGIGACVELGRLDLLEAFSSTMVFKEKKLAELSELARAAAAGFAEYETAVAKPLAVKAPTAGWKNKAGNYALRLEGFVPWKKPTPGLDLAKYPVYVSVPKGYTGNESYGLIISMMNAQGSSQYPKPEYAATLEKRKLIYVGFDPYNGVFEDWSGENAYVNHELLCLAAAYHILGNYNIDRSRVYLAGFSWGGRLTGEIAPRWPTVFTGGIAVGGCFTSPDRIFPSYRMARERVAMVLATGDWDYNRAETYNGYSAFLAMGYAASFIQEPKRAHARISGPEFERSIAFLDDLASRRRE